MSVNALRGWSAWTAATVLITLVVAPSAHGDFIQLGGTYTVRGTNFPTNFSQSVTVSTAPTLINSGQLLHTVTVFPDGPDAEWVDFSFSRVGGGPLAGNINANWSFNIDNVPLTQTVEWDRAIIWFTVNGTAVSPISPFAGFQNVIPNPINPALGPVYSQTFTPSRIVNDIDEFAFVNPYSFISAGGMNPNTVNDLHVAVHLRALTPTVIPEPSSGLLAALGFGVSAVAYRLRRRRCCPGVNINQAAGAQPRPCS
jgi:hypothetical protein